MNRDIERLVIVGAGPAGLSASIQAHRCGILPLVVEEGDPGGSLRGARRVDNYPGLPSLPGTALAGLLVSHAGREGLRLLRARVLSVRCGNPHEVSLESGGTVAARGVILAAGQRTLVPPTLAGLEPSGALLLPGSFRPSDWCGRRVAVVGGGDVALDQALLLRDHGAAVRVVCRGPLRAGAALRREAAAAGLEVRAGWEPSGAEGKGPVQLRFRPLGGEGAEWVMEVDGVLPATGKGPHPLPVGAGPVSGPGAFPGIWVAGDMGRGRDRQAVLAAGDGCAAALAAARYLETC